MDTPATDDGSQSSDNLIEDKSVTRIKQNTNSSKFSIASIIGGMD